jgi:cell division protein FtsB
LYAQAKERKFEDLKTQAALEAKNLYDYSVEQKIAREKTAANSKLQSWIYRICIIMLLFAVFVTYNFIKKKAREKEERTKYQLLILDYIKTVEELGTQKQQLKALLIENEEIIKDKNNNEAKIEELSAEKANLEALIRELEGKRAPMEEAIAQNAKRLNDSNIIRYFRKHLEHPQQYPIMPEHFKKLQGEIEYDFPTFFLQTHSRGHISDTEYCLCLLIKAGFSVKHINLLLGKNDYASSTRRRLLMKIYGENGSPEDFDNKIRAII